MNKYIVISAKVAVWLALAYGVLSVAVLTTAIAEVHFHATKFGAGAVFGSTIALALPAFDWIADKAKIV